MTEPPTTQHTKISFDREAYRSYIRDMGLSAQQQDALMQAVWSILVGVMDFCVEHGASETPLAADSSAVISFLTTSKTNEPEDATSPVRAIAREIDS